MLSAILERGVQFAIRHLGALSHIPQLPVNHNSMQFANFATHPSGKEPIIRLLVRLNGQQAGPSSA